MIRLIACTAAGIALTGFATAATAQAATVDAGGFSSRASCERAGQARVNGTTILGYRCSATSPNSVTGDYDYELYLESRDANRPCQNGGTGSAAASAEAFCLFQNR